MRVLHVPYTYAPDPLGGTEVYVTGLVHALHTLGISGLIAAPGRTAGRAVYEGIPVRRVAVSPTLSTNDLYGDGDPVAAHGFSALLEEERPDLLHLHALTPAVSLRLVREAARRRIPTVLTYHTPTVTCQRGTLLRWGAEVCDGRLDLDFCTRCTLHGLGVPRPLADLAGRVPVAVGRAIGVARLNGLGWTALRLRGLMTTRLAATRSVLAEVTHLVAVCQWARDLLVRNEVPPAKITLCRHGIPRAEAPAPAPTPAPPGSSLRVTWLGRFDHTKGAHLLMEALRARPALPLALDLYGVPQGPGGNRYAEHLRAKAGDDLRIRFQAAFPAEDAVARLQAYDMVAIPSQCLETGPQVILEAFAAGVPVVGSRLGGIAELVTEGVDGLLVEPPGSVAAWEAVLARLCDDRALVARLRAGITPVRTMADVATEMAALYRRLKPTA